MASKSAAMHCHVETYRVPGDKDKKVSYNNTLHAPEVEETQVGGRDGCAQIVSDTQVIRNHYRYLQLSSYASLAFTGQRAMQVVCA